VTRVELRGSEEAPSDRLFTGIVRQQLLVQFKQADKDKNGYLDEKEANDSRVFRGLFKVMDRDGDGKLYEKEVVAYLDQTRALQARANASCVSLVLSDQSRGLFDLLDSNRDGRLSLREMRQAPKLLAQLDRGDKGYLSKDDIPRTYQLALNRGPVNAGDLGVAAAAFSRYFGGSSRSGPPEPTAGPLWFRKMDLNRDGDVSRSEFLGSDELFRKIDTDGDGLISLEEAERYDAQLRKQK